MQLNPIYTAMIVVGFVVMGGLWATQVGARSSLGKEVDMHGFRRLDVDGNGVITRAEVQAPRISKFTQVDTNNDGKITSAEMIEARNMRLVEETAKCVAIVINKFDRDQDGALSADELPDVDGNLFDRVDANGNGIVSQEEFDTAKLEMHMEMKERSYRRKAQYEDVGE